MPRVKRGNKRRERRKKILSLAKGFFLTKGKLYRSAQESIMRAGNFAYTGRKLSTSASLAGPLAADQPQKRYRRPQQL